MGLGYKHTEEAKEKMRLAHLGHVHSEETKLKMGMAHKGHQYTLGYKHTDEAKARMSEAQKRIGNRPPPPLIGHSVSEETRRKIGAKQKGELNYNWGKHTPPEVKKKLSDAMKGRCGEQSGGWRGGVCPENQKIRMCSEMKEWRESVFERDNYTCQKCKQRGSQELNAHHVHNFNEFPKLRFDITNGITFCKDCHILFHKIYNRFKNNNVQVMEFINE